MYPELIATTQGNKKSNRSNVIKLPRPVAPFDRDPAKAAAKCFDRDTGIAVPVGALKTYKDALAQYHLRPEHKFQNGNYTDRGITRRRHVKPSIIRNIGKESNRWQEKFFLGSEQDAEIDYGRKPEESKAFLEELRAKVMRVDQRQIARLSRISRRTISRFLAGNTVRSNVIARIVQAVGHP